MESLESENKNNGFRILGMKRRNGVFGNNYAVPYQTSFVETLYNGDYVSAIAILNKIPEGTSFEENILRLQVIAQGFKYLSKHLVEEHQELHELLKNYELEDVDEVETRLAELEKFEKVVGSVGGLEKIAVSRLI